MFLEAGELCPSCNPPPSSQLVYRIESGWDGNPFWYCSVRLGGAGHAHLHLGRDVYDGPTCGLEFQARGTWWPVEARWGIFLFAASQEAARAGAYYAITREEAVAYLVAK
jgi:hypothetical protein